MAKSAATLAGDLADLAGSGGGIPSSRLFGGAGAAAAAAAPIDCSRRRSGGNSGVPSLCFLGKKTTFKKNDKSPF
jgi:hypothetical protein